MDQFPDRHHVRLRSRALGGYLHAADDGESVVLRRSRASLNAAWEVHLRPNGGRGVHLLLHSAAYGRYLAANTAAPAPPGHRGSRAEQRDYDHPVVPDIMWEAVRAGSQGDVMLRTVGGHYLRANGRYRRWKNGVSVDGDYITTMARWAVERIPRREGAPALPPPIPIRVQGRLSGIIFGRQERDAWRTIRFFIENGFSQGLYPENGWHNFPFLGRSVFHLSEELSIRVRVLNGRPAPRLRHVVPSFGEADLPDGFVICVRAGRHGRLTPLVVDLPRGGDGETLEIIVALSGTQVYHELRHPDVDARRERSEQES
ncbi:hypothetical protein CFC21_054507 [Triticum aestivum]|uniref:Uncharacterized protein n=2 Tax=Triticum aestivum TaxID=4565 RepID=A0A3B6I473_WHEAT|nr:uncharacterized protein LOC123082879 [Triticum aestivum]KAF7045396.1 hypothetical protein CFC21_054507 [Triticum aestivum]